MMIKPEEGSSTSEDESEERIGPYSITENDLIKRLNRNAYSGKISTQIFSCVVVSMAHLSFGTCLGWASPKIYKAKEEMLNKGFGNFLTWMTSMVPLGSCLGFGVWTIVGHKNGPRKILLIQSSVFLLLGIIIFFVEWEGSVIASRFFLGFFGIAYIVCGRMLLNDTIHIQLLKYARIAPDVSILVGVFFVQVAGIIQESHNGGLACIGITFLTQILLFVMPESPVFLFKKGEKFAEDSLEWYMGKKHVSECMRRIRRDNEYRRIEDKFILHSKVVRKTLLIIIGIVVLQVLSGYHLFLFYGIIIWSGEPIVNESMDVLVIGLVLVFSRLFWSIIHVKLELPVRQFLILSCIIVGTSQLILGSLLLLSTYRQFCAFGDLLKWYSFSCCFFIIFSFELGLNHYVNILLKRYLPIQVAQTASTMVYSVHWFLIFFVIKFNGFWHIHFPSWLLFAAASILLYIGAVAIYVFVVEVKGKSLVQIQLDIGGNPIGTRESLYLRRTDI